MRRDDRPSCPNTGKIRYTSASQAKRGHAHAHFRIRVYRCDWCGGFHATNAEKDRGGRV